MCMSVNIYYIICEKHLFGWLDKYKYSLKEINVSHLPAHELDYFVDTGFLKKERDNIVIIEARWTLTREIRK